MVVATADRVTRGDHDRRSFTFPTAHIHAVDIKDPHEFMERAVPFGAAVPVRMWIEE